jgi:hypothetical protein
MKTGQIVVFFGFVGALSPTGTNILKLGFNAGYRSSDPTLVDYIQGVHIRVKQLNEQNSTLISADTRLDLNFRNHEFDPSLTIQNAISIMNDGAVVTIGAGYSSRTILSSLIWQTAQIPQCDGYASNPSLSNKATYVLFF